MALRFVAAKLFVVCRWRFGYRSEGRVLFAVCTADSVACSSGLFRRAQFRFYAIRFGEKTRDHVDAHGHIDGCE
jgi:hypothetical protein